MSTKALSLRGAAVVLSLLGAVAARAEPAIAAAAMNGDLKAVRTLVRQTVNAAQADGMTALHWAVQRRDLDMTNLLLTAGADFSIANRTGAKPLYLAAVNGDAAAIGRLLEAGEDANAVLTGEGESVLMLTAYTGNPAAVKLLIPTRNRSAARRPSCGRRPRGTPMLCACCSSAVRILRSRRRRRRSQSAALRAA
jgi:ankyrin repeat protein